MKLLIAAIVTLVTFISLTTLARDEVPDCFREKTAVNGQFILFLDPTMSVREKSEVLQYLARQDIAVLVDLLDETLLVENISAPVRTRFQEEQILESLQALIGNGVDGIACNRMTRMQHQRYSTFR